MDWGEATAVTWALPEGAPSCATHSQGEVVVLVPSDGSVAIRDKVTGLFQEK